MLPSNFSALRSRRVQLRNVTRQHLFGLLGVLLFFVLMGIEFGPINGPQVHASPLNHTVETVNGECSQFYYTSDGNPFPLCPGPYPRGGNCVWWGWEMWHLLGYNLPDNWGNAADWIVDAERTGLPLGRTPRVGSLAVFPVGDGVWAFGPAGHIGFVTSVSPDGTSFNVTYQNYGDPTPMHIGIGYNVSVINEPRFQNGHLRFIYFPGVINAQLFSRLPGINGNDLSGVAQANQLLANGSSTGSDNSDSSSTLTGTRIALGLAPASSDQEFNADFAGTGLSDLLLYNRQQGSLEILSLSSNKLSPSVQKYLPKTVYDEIAADSNNAPVRVSLGDSIHPINGWGSSLDIHIGDFTGTGESELLLYDRVTGTLQFISFTPQLTIKKHVVLSGWGPGWELYVGRMDGNRTGIFMYNRLVNEVPIQTPTVTVTPGPGPASGPAASVTPSSSTGPASSPPIGPARRPARRRVRRRPRLQHPLRRRRPVRRRLRPQLPQRRQVLLRVAGWLFCSIQSRVRIRVLL